MSLSKAAIAAVIYVSCTTTLFVGVEGFSTTPAIAISSNRAKTTTIATTTSLRSHHRQANDRDGGDDEEPCNSGVKRREILRTIAASAVSGFVVQTSLPRASWAGIDVSGIRVEGSAGGTSGKASPNAALQQQLRAYDGSGSARIQQIQQEIKPPSSSRTTTTPGATPTSSTLAETEALPFAATYAYRSNPGVQPQLKKAGIAGERYRYQDSLALVSKASSSSSQSRGGYVNVQFEFPSDWLQLDRSLGGIQYVDQRNGDKLIVLKAPLPDGESLISVPKQWFAQTVFDPKGTIVASTGIDVDEFKTSRSTILNDGVSTATSPHRRLLLKYATVTPNGLRTERRGLIDAYEINNVAYMMFTGSNAVKFEQNGPERETVERIVDSFVVEAIR